MNATLSILAILMLKLFSVVLPIALVGGAGWVLFKRSATGRALQERIHHGTEDGVALRELETQVAQLEEQMVELQERVDFAERRLIEQAPGDG